MAFRRGMGRMGRYKEECSHKDAERLFLKPPGIAGAEAGCVRPMSWKFIAAFSAGCSMEGQSNPDFAFEKRLISTSLFENMLTKGAGAGCAMRSAR